MSIDDVMRQFTAELDVCCDALLAAGWPPSRMLQVKESSFDPFDAEIVTIVLKPGVEFADELPVFQVSFVWDRRAPSVQSVWLVDPLPTPHASTVAAANPAPRPTHCPHCEHEISDDTCWCGEDLDHRYGPSDGHVPVPMGCVCHLTPSTLSPTSTGGQGQPRVPRRGEGQ